MQKQQEQAVQYIKSRGIKDPQVGIVLGTGLGKMIDEIEIESIIEYADIPNFPLSTVEFHKGRLIYGKLEGKKILAMQGRFHYYEGYTLQQVTFPIRVMKLLGIQYFFFPMQQEL
jgi:purine-nucleoside phosphorylase